VAGTRDAVAGRRREIERRAVRVEEIAGEAMEYHREMLDRETMGPGD
jgi:hypothetical protein